MIEMVMGIDGIEMDMKKTKKKMTTTTKMNIGTKMTRMKKKMTTTTRVNFGTKMGTTTRINKKYVGMSFGMSQLA